MCVCGGVPVLVQHFRQAVGRKKTQPPKQTGSSGPSPPSPCPPGSQSNHVAIAPKHLFVREGRAREGGAPCCRQCGWGGVHWGSRSKTANSPSRFLGHPIGTSQAFLPCPRPHCHSMDSRLVHCLHQVARYRPSGGQGQAPRATTLPSGVRTPQTFPRIPVKSTCACIAPHSRSRVL